MKLVPLGDQAVLAYPPDEAAAVALAWRVREAAPPWLVDVVPAYASVGVHFDPDVASLQVVVDWLGSLSAAPVSDEVFAGRLFEVPVLYDGAPDMGRVCARTGLSADEVVREHTSVEYTVYAVGFVPGFPYLGYLPERLRGVGRLDSPRLRVEPGSVGLTGRQTGIYPLPRPGGWNLIGRTPLVLVDLATWFFPLRVGDRVRFRAIDDHQFQELVGKRLEPTS